MQKHIFITNGVGGCGKDTFAFYMKANISTMKYSSIDEIKKAATHCGWHGGKTEKDRKFLSDLKLLATEYSDAPFNAMKRTVDLFYTLPYSVLLIDIREPEEIDRAKKEFGAKTILIRNDRVAPIESNMADANVENYDYDFVIENNGTLEDLRKTVCKFIDENIKERNN